MSTSYAFNSNQRQSLRMRPTHSPPTNRSKKHARRLTCTPKPRHASPPHKHTTSPNTHRHKSRVPQTTVQQQFLAAVQNQNRKQVQHLLLLEKQAHHSTLVNHHNNTALFIAADNNDAKMCALLFDHGARHNQPNFEGWCPVHRACALGHNDFLCALIKRRDKADHWCDVNRKTSKGLTPLMLAVVSSQSLVIDTLLWVAEANKKLVDEGSNMTALDFAKQEGNALIIDQFKIGTRVRSGGGGGGGGGGKTGRERGGKVDSSARRALVEEEPSMLMFNAIDHGWRPVKGL
jgi:hypothetical protein